MSVITRSTAREPHVFERLRSGLKRPVPAIPVDLFRILIGAIGLVYFAETLMAAQEFSAPDGLIDHGFVREVLWYTQFSVFPSGIGLAALQLVFVAACLACALLTIGYRPRLMAAVCYVVAVSTYRWNFPVTYLDDATIHLAFFWLMLLPTGSTLTVGQWRRDDAKIWSEWRDRWVPGVAVRCLLANVALLYVVAGFWKWTSPMWRDGSALYVALQTPVSRAPDFWTPGWAPVLTVLCLTALVLEPVLPAMFVLPANHRLKWVLLFGALGLHGGILLSMKVPYTNAILIIVSVLTFRDEIMQLISRGSAVVRPPREAGPLGLRGAVSIGFVALLSLAMVGEVTVSAWRHPTRVAHAATDLNDRSVDSSEPSVTADQPGVSGSGHNPLYAPLWLMGIAQSYRLFDWVDDRNWDIRHEVNVWSDAGSSRPGAPVFGNSIRHVLLQTYTQGVTWGPIAGTDLAEFRRTVLHRYADRYCTRQDLPDRATIEVTTLTRRITVDNSIDRERTRSPLMSFECEDALAVSIDISETRG